MSAPEPPPNSQRTARSPTMGSTFAGTLGTLAMAFVMGRGVFMAADPEVVSKQAVVGLVAFATIGYFIGRIAEWTMRENLRTRLQAEVAALEANKEPAGTAHRG